MKEICRFENIDWLVQNGGDISVGEFATVPCTAIASDEDQCLAMLARKEDESLNALLQRLDAAIKDAWENQIYADEING